MTLNLQTKGRRVDTSLLRILKLLCVTLLVGHWIGCSWFTLARVEFERDPNAANWAVAVSLNVMWIFIHTDFVFVLPRMACLVRESGLMQRHQDKLCALCIGPSQPWQPWGMEILPPSRFLKYASP